MAAPPILYPQPRPAKKPPWLLIGILMTVVCVVGLGGALAFGYFWQASAKEVPMPANVRQALLTAEDFDGWFEKPLGKPTTETAVLKEAWGKSMTAEYEWESEGFYISSTVEYGGGRLGADGTDFAMLTAIQSRAEDQEADKMEVRAANEFFKWGDRSTFAHIHNRTGDRIGFRFIALNGNRLIYYLVVGVSVETSEDLREILKDSLAAVEALPIRPD